jgi:hypothetical protein
MQTKYTPKMSLRNKIVTWGVVGLMVLVSGGCGSNEQSYSERFKRLSPEEQAKWRQAEYNLLVEKYKQDENKKKEELAACEQLSKYNRQMQQQPQTDRDADVIDDMKGRVGGNLATQGLLQFLSDYKK